MTKEWFLKRLDKLRMERGWSKCKLSEESGLAAGVIYRWYKTKRMPSIDAIEKICKACHITMSEFFAESDEEELKYYEFSRVKFFFLLTQEQQDVVINTVQAYMNVFGKANE